MDDRKAETGTEVTTENDNHGSALWALQAPYCVSSRGCPLDLSAQEESFFSSLFFLSWLPDYSKEVPGRLSKELGTN